MERSNKCVQRKDTSASPSSLSHPVSMKHQPSLLFVSRPFSQADKRRAVADILEHAVPDRDFYVLVIGAVLLAVGGIFLDSISVLIASMIVAPLAYPILGLGFAITSRNGHLALQSIVMFVASLILALGIGMASTFLLGELRAEPVFISFTANRFLATAIAVIAGWIAAYGLVRSKVGGAMTGIGIAVSLMPPLVITGIESAAGHFPAALNAMILFLLNVVGILLGSILVFASMRLGASKT